MIDNSNYLYLFINGQNQYIYEIIKKLVIFKNNSNIIIVNKIFTILYKSKKSKKNFKIYYI